MALPLTYIPYNDSNPVRYRGFPYGTVALIVTNVLVHIMMMVFFTDGYGRLELYQQWRIWGSVPDHIQGGWGMPGFSALTSMFLHGDWLHLIFNMVFLWTFGKRIEDACGTARFLLFYLTAGITGDCLTVGAHGLGLIGGGYRTSIGASGAIAGVMGAYLLLFPRQRITGLIFVTAVALPIPKRVRLPSVVYLLYFLAVQLYYSYLTVVDGMQFGIGFLAHLGGFLSGLLVLLYVRKDVFCRYWTPAEL